MPQHRFNRFFNLLRPLLWSGALLLLAGCVGPMQWGDGTQTTIRPETDSTRVIQSIYGTVTWITVGIFIVVAGLLVFALVRYRAKPGEEGKIPEQVHGNALLEVIWTVIPAIILIVIAVPTWSGIFRAARPPAQGAFSVQAIGHQWWWEFKYDEQGITTANEMVIPVGQPVVVKTHSIDVIHSFWVPKLSGKIDTLPGKTNVLWFTPEQPGTYYGQCAEFCGTSHANMRFRVEVVTPEQFQEWLQKQRQPPQTQSADAEAGAQLFLSKGCVACHTISGVPVAVGILGPNLTNLAGRATIAAGIVDNTPDNLVRWIRHTQDVKPGARMGIAQEDGSYKPFDMTDDEARQIAAFLLSPPGAVAAAPAAPAATGAPTAEDLFAAKACIGCHKIPGIAAAVGTVGPDLAGLMSRPTIAAGKLPTNPENIKKWITNPKAVKPDTLMVTPPLSEAEIDTIVAYLVKLK